MEFSEMINEIQTTYRRNRTFTADEVDTLLDVMLKYGHIVERKSISGPCMQNKNKAWETICKEFNKVHPNHRRSLRELHTKYKNLKNQFKRRCSGRDPADPTTKLVDDKIRKIRNAGSREDNNSDSNISSLFTALLEYPDEADTKSFVLNEPLENFAQESTVNDVSMNDSSSISEEDMGTFKKVDVSTINDPLKHPIQVDELTSFRAKPQHQSAILDLVRTKHELAAEKAKKELEILNIEHSQKLEHAKIEHTRRLEIMNKEHELIVEKLKLEIELLRKN